MFIGHLPAGYLLTKYLQNRLNTQSYLTIGLLASILPDSDLLYFFFIDNRRTLHHDYWIHIPFYWVLLFSVSFVLSYVLKKREWIHVSLIFFSNIFLHLILDTIVGKIQWLYPVITTSFSLFEVPAKHSWWVMNFVYHWTFLLEIAIWAMAYAVHKSFKSSVHKH